MIYRAVLNGNRPITVRSIQGFATASTKAGSNPNLPVERQGLVACFAAGVTTDKMVADPLPKISGANAWQVDAAFFAIPFKIMGWGSQGPVPINLFWEGGRMLPTGAFLLAFQFATIWPPSEEHPTGGVNLDDGTECLDIETQFGVEFA